ncbi:MAG: hypothetical protein QNJ13_08715 [Paracoccaceae bacterium]|nr:hypothetical protein [Paracoccaceae bacterium]
MGDDKSRQGYDDVLSSVRRIVASEAGNQAESEAGKLLLTPALRVPEAEAEPDRPAPEPLAEREFPTLEERIADLEAAVGSEPAEWEPDGSEDQAQHAPNAVVLPLNRGVRRAEPADRSAETNDEDLVFAVPGETETAASDPATVSEEDGGPAETDDEPAPPGAPSVATFRHRDQLPEPAPDHPADDDEPALLDEAGLRDLVAEIVREELQGGLGERITRNVRKLVRAEIQRAFAARDLD